MTKRKLSNVTKAIIRFQSNDQILHVLWVGLYKLVAVQITEEKGKTEDFPTEADGITPFLGHTHSITTFSFAVVTLEERCVA